MDFISKKFEELNTYELYEILKARSEIFIKEQNINYQDMDNIDYSSFHFFFIENNKIIAYLRAFYQGDDHDIVKIGRVLTLNHGKGIGKDFMKQSLNAIKEKMTCKKICMDSQKHAEGFYRKFGFKTVSGEFLEEGVVHVKMELEL